MKYFNNNLHYKNVIDKIIDNTSANDENIQTILHKNLFDNEHTWIIKIINFCLDDEDNHDFIFNNLYKLLPIDLQNNEKICIHLLKKCKELQEYDLHSLFDNLDNDMLRSENILLNVFKMFDELLCKDGVDAGCTNDYCDEMEYRVDELLELNEFKISKSVALYFLDYNGYLLHDLKLELQEDEEIVRRALCHKFQQINDQPNPFKYVPHKFKNNKKFIHSILEEDTYDLNWFISQETISDELKNDKDFILSLSKYNDDNKILNINHLHTNLQNDKEIVLSIINISKHNLKFVNDELKKDEDIKHIIIKHSENYRSIEYLPIDMILNITECKNNILQHIKNKKYIEYYNKHYLNKLKEKDKDIMNAVEDSI
jgi:hypothetical protein